MIIRTKSIKLEFVYCGINKENKKKSYEQIQRIKIKRT